MSLFVRYEPEINRMSLSHLVDAVPYILNDPIIQHPDYQMNFLVGIEGDPDPSVRARAAFAYRRVQQYAVVEDVLQQGLWNVEYPGTVRVLEFEAELAYDVTTENRLSGSLILRDVQHVSSGATVPYSPFLEGRAIYRHILAMRLALETRLRVVGTRYVDAENERRLPALAVVDLSTEYEPLPRLMIGLGIQNLFGTRQEWWEGYAGLPRTAMLFARYVW
jgi:outer membrane receptor protein involved in Fe transport